MQRGTFGFPLVSPWLAFFAVFRPDRSWTMSGIPGYEPALNAAMMSVRSLPSVRHPWETNNVTRQIFGSDDNKIKRPRLNLSSSSSAIGKNRNEHRCSFLPCTSQRQFPASDLRHSTSRLPIQSWTDSAPTRPG